MENLKHLIALNIAALRRAQGMTQITLAEKLHYSDKAISKWERGESLPDISVLKEIADLFGVTVDYLLYEHTDDKLPEPAELPDEIEDKKEMMVTIHSCCIGSNGMITPSPGGRDGFYP